MSIAIIECTAELIIFTRFIKRNDGIVLHQQVQKELKCSIVNWIEHASKVIKEWVREVNVSFPITLLLPDFALLTKNIKVPKVGSSKQKYVIQSHISQSLGLSGQESVRFVVRSFDENEMDVICAVIKQDWIESFCESLASIGDKIVSIQPGVIHYYNAFNLLFPLTIKNILLLVFQETSVSCLFIGQNNLLIFKIQLNNNDFNTAIKELLEFHNNKYPDNIPEEVLVGGLSINESSKEFLYNLSNYIRLPIRIFSPLGNENACCLGSIGFAYANLLNDGLFFDLTPDFMRKNWSFRRSKKAFLFAGISVLAGFSLLLVGLTQQEKRYEQLIETYERKIQPLRRNASIIESNEKKIRVYEEGFSSLQKQMQSSYSWINFLNALQSILAQMPRIQIHTLKILDTEVGANNFWKEEMMGVSSQPSIGSRMLNLGGILHIENPNQSSRETIGDIKYLVNELSKLEFIEETKNLNFDVKAFPNVPFSIAFIIKPQIL